MVRAALPGATPTPLEAFACGSRSTSNVGFSAAARLAARLTAVVVLPTPPFWLAIAMMFGRPGMSARSVAAPGTNLEHVAPGLSKCSPRVLEFWKTDRFGVLCVQM